MWRCLCGCGKETVVEACNLSSGRQISCGCYRDEKARSMTSKHGKTDSRLYGVWCAIKSRCYNPNVPEYRYYGARGISMCDEWRQDFVSFYDWMMSHGYDPSQPRGVCTIDRIDYNGPYSPENCRIVSQLEQMNNVRSNHTVEYNGETHTIAEWSRITGINQFKIRNRISKLGWSPERTLTTK